MEPLTATHGHRFETEGAVIEFERLVEKLGARLDHLADEGLEAIRGRVPRWLADTGAVWEQLRDCIRGALRTEWAAFRDGILPGRLPDFDETLIVMASRVGDLDSILSGYRFAQMALWGSWFELIEASVEKEPVKRELLRHGSQYFFRYSDLISRFMAEGYQRGLERVAANGDHHRFEALKRLLDADPLDNFHLDVQTSNYHIALVAWGEGADEEARGAAREIDRPLILVPRLDQNWWGWMSGSRPSSDRDWEKLRRFKPREGVRLAFGLEGYGEPGFRASNHQALRAQWVSSPERPVTHYDEVAVEALATESEGDARAFVAHELRGIDDDSATSTRLRETLAAYFEAELNAATAAAALGVHHQTVTNRLRAIEERLGYPPGSRHLELAVALRLRASLGPDEW